MSEGNPFRTEILEPRECSTQNLAQFRALVLEGGEVDEHTLSALIEQATALAFIRRADIVVGVGAVKRPSASYRKKVFAEAQSRLTEADFKLELGWIYVTPAARGNRLTTPMVAGLLQRAQGVPLYATSHVDNTWMHASLEHCGFRKEGTPYPSKRREVDIQLFVLA